MKTTSLQISALVVVSLIFASMIPVAFAANQPDCTKIQDACGEAGYTRNVPGGKDLMTACFDPIMKGQTIANVKVDSDTVKKCQSEQATSTSKKRRH